MAPRTWFLVAPVLQTVRSAGVLRHVPADGGGLLAGRVGGEEESTRHHRTADRQVDAPGLDGRRSVGKVDVQDAIHAGEDDQHAACRGDGPAGKPRAGPPRDDRDSRGRAEPHHRRHLVGARRQDDEIGCRPVVRGERVALVHAKLVWRRHDPVGPHDFLAAMEKATTCLDCHGDSGHEETVGLSASGGAWSRPGDARSGLDRSEAGRRHSTTQVSPCLNRLLMSPSPCFCRAASTCLAMASS